MLLQGQLLMLWVDNELFCVVIRLFFHVNQVTFRFHIDGSELPNENLVLSTKGLVNSCNFFITIGIKAFIADFDDRIVLYILLSLHGLHELFLFL